MPAAIGNGDVAQVLARVRLGMVPRKVCEVP